MAWVPVQSAIPPGFIFPDTNGDARLDQLWHLPAQCDVLAVSCYTAGDAEAQLAPLEEGVQLVRPLLSLVQATLLQVGGCGRCCHWCRRRCCRWVRACMFVFQGGTRGMLPKGSPGGWGRGRSAG